MILKRACLCFSAPSHNRPLVLGLVVAVIVTTIILTTHITAVTILNYTRLSCVDIFHLLPPIIPPPPDQPKGKPSRPAYLSIDVKGRLGNQMFIYASLLGICNTTGHVPLLPPAVDLLAYFPHISRHINSCRQEYSRVPSFMLSEDETNEVYMDHEVQPGVYDTQLVDRLARERRYVDVLLGGYYQSYKYFQQIAPTIRQHFSLRPEVDMAARDYLHHLRQYYSARRVIGIHIRREDYVIATDGRAMADADYLSRAMAFLAPANTTSKASGDSQKDVVFLVCSTPDGIEWSRDTMLRHLSAYKVAYSVGRSPVEDLSLLVHTDHLILSVGTFGWWAGYLGPGYSTGGSTRARGHVLYLGNMSSGTLAEGKRNFIQGYNMDDYFPPHWISL